MPFIPFAGQSKAADIGSALGKGLGAGVSQQINQGLDLLAQQKMQQLQAQQQQAERQRYAQSLQSIPGMQPGVAEFVSNLSPDERKIALGNIDKLLNLYAPQAQGGAQGILPQEITEGVTGAQPAGQELRSPQDTAKVLSDVFTSPQEKREKEKILLKKQQMEQQASSAAWKNTAPYREKILDTEEKSEEALSAIKEAQELEKSGELPSQSFASFLKGAEWEDVPGFLSGSAEAFNKILANFQRGAKDIYGGRITNFEMEQFLKTIPTLQHTPEGRARIFSMMKNYYRAGKERAKLMRKIIKENKGVPPEDLHERVNKKFKPIAKELSKKFKDDLKEAEKLRSAASRIGSVASYGAGKIVSGIPGALKGAAKGAGAGAAIGSFIPGVGTVPGALVGGGLGALGGGGLSDLIKLLL